MNEKCNRCNQTSGLLSDNGMCLSCVNDMKKKESDDVKIEDINIQQPVNQMRCANCNEIAGVVNDNGYCLKCSDARTEPDMIIPNSYVSEPNKVCNSCGASSSSPNVYINNEGICRQCKLENQAELIIDSHNKDKPEEIKRTPVINLKIYDPEREQARLFDIQVQKEEIAKTTELLPITRYEFDCKTGREIDTVFHEGEEDDDDE